mmetsp:Transcript_13140/g.40445  ORF Transcript_13140/g.40445 Transcript_13140/m.40445 type:complete len:825 (+) Transcript_13140:3-2477(+)
MESKKSREGSHYFSEAIRLNPEDAVSYHGYALLLIESSPSRAQEATVLLRTAVQLSPDYAEAKRSLAVNLTNIGVRLKHADFPVEAMQFYSEALAADSSYDQACYNLGVAYADMGVKDKALEFYMKTIQRNSLHAEALCNAGVIYKEKGDVHSAILNYERALLAKPNFDLAKSNLAIALCDVGTEAKLCGQRRDAVRLYKKALACNPAYPSAHYNLGVAYAEERKLERALVHYELAIKFNPGLSGAYNNLGVVYKDLGNLEKSLESYKGALAADKQNYQMHNNIAVVYTLIGNVDLAAKHLECAISLDPEYAEGHNNIGVLLRDKGDVEGAIKHYDICCSLDSNNEMAPQNRLHALNYVESYTPEKVFEEHREWGRKFQGKVDREITASAGKGDSTAQLLLKENLEPDSEPRGRKRPLRIGYVSPDFFTHSVSYFIEVMLAHHTEEVEVFIYSNVQNEDPKTERLKCYPSVMNNWRKITGLSSLQVAARVLEDRIDVLVELAGHTNGNRLDVMAVRPAPVQVTWIGYPNTTGLPSIDFRVTDGVVDPVDTTQKFTEELWRLPKVFLCYTPAVDAPEQVSLPPLASSGGIVTLGSFNVLAKMQASTVALWARLLKAVPQARLLLKAKPFASRSAQDRVRELFKNHGVDASRIDLVPLIHSTRSHLEAYGNVDVALDPFPYSGTTTTCEALYMGVPVVTLASPKGKDFHAHNVGVTLLTAIGHPELIAHTDDEYVEIVTSLVSDVDALTKLRERLRGDMMASPLGQPLPFVRDVENMYFDMWTKRGGIVARKKVSKRTDAVAVTPTPTSFVNNRLDGITNDVSGTK